MMLAAFVACSDDDYGKVFNSIDMSYNLGFDPANFETDNVLCNTYFAMTPGTIQIFAAEEKDGVPIQVESECSKRRAK